MENIQSNEEQDLNSQRAENAEKYPDVVKLFLSLVENIKPNEEQDLKSQRAENAEKYPDVVELFSSLLSNDKGIKLDGKKEESVLQESFKGSEFIPDPRNPSNSILAYISYWFAVFLSEGEEFSSNRPELFKQLVPKIKSVASDVREILKKNECTDWIAFSKLVPMIKYSTNALKREYLLFFDEIRVKIGKWIEDKLPPGYQKTKKRRLMMQKKSEIEKLLKENEEAIVKNIKTLIETYVNVICDYYRFIDIDEFVDRLMLRIPYNYLIYFKTEQFTDWNWVRFLFNVEKMDSKKDTNEFMDSVFPTDQKYDPTDPLIFTSFMLKRPRIFMKEYVDSMNKCHFSDDDELDEIVIYIKSDEKISLSYKKIFYSSFINTVESYCYTDFRFSGDGTKEQTIYNFISRWTERRKNTDFVEPLTFNVYLLEKFDSIEKEPEFWVEKLNETGQILSRHYTLIKDVCVDGGLCYSKSNKNENVEYDDFVNDWIEKLKPPHDTLGSKDLRCFHYFMNVLNKRVGEA